MADAARLAREHGATACTDITGFGFAGHLGEVLKPSGCSAIVRFDDLPQLPGAASLLGRGLRSTAHPENARVRREISILDGASARPDLDLLFDPQTSGGLLLGLDEDRARGLVEALHAAGDDFACIVGRVTEPRTDGMSFEVR